MKLGIIILAILGLAGTGVFLASDSRASCGTIYPAYCAPTYYSEPCYQQPCQQYIPSYSFVREVVREVPVAFPLLVPAFQFQYQQPCYAQPGGASYGSSYGGQSYPGGAGAYGGAPGAYGGTPARSASSPRPS